MLKERKERKERKTPKEKGIKVNTRISNKDIIKEISLNDKSSNILMGKLIEQGIAKFLYYANDCRYFQVKKLI